MESLDGKRYLAMVCSGAAWLNAQRQLINELNVFPIPDGDTGDNMFMTLEAGCRVTPGPLGKTAAAVSQGMLTGARGNSGVILSRIFAGIAQGLSGLEEAGLPAFEQAMACGVEASYKAVANPVEGTMLTVFREGVAAAAGSDGFDAYFDTLCSAMDRSLQHTPELLDVLRNAGVVDSGGAGLLQIVEGMRAGLHGEAPPCRKRARKRPGSPSISLPSPRTACWNSATAPNSSSVSNAARSTSSTSTKA